MTASLRLSAHIGFTFKELPFERRIEAARAAGFDAVEHPQPFEIPAARMRQLTRAAGVTFSQLGVATVQRGLACLPERRQEFRDLLAQSLDYAAEIGCPLVHPMAGVVPPEADMTALWRTYDDNLAHAIGAAAERGLSVIVEPISHVGTPGFLIHTAELGLQALGRAPAPGARLLLDAFHCWAAGEDFAAIIEQDIGAVGHIHAAGFPGRHEPDTGSHSFDFLLPLLARAGYGGAIGFEYIPAGETAAGLGWLDHWRATRDGLLAAG